MGRTLTFIAILGIAHGLVSGSASAQTQIRPRFMIAFDTSGSMAVDLEGIPTFGDGIPGPTQGIDTNCDGEIDDSRIYVAKDAVRNVVRAFGDIEFGLTAFPRFPRSQSLCNHDDGIFTGSPLQIQNQECNIASGPFVGGIGDPTMNTGAALTLGNCGSQWDGIGGDEIPTALIPAACRPGAGGNPPARLWAAGSPEFCVNYAGACPGTTFPGLYTFPQGDVLVGFQGFSWPATQDNRSAILRWLDNAETSFNASTTTGNYCNHAGSGDCELRPNGPTPLGGVLNAARSYMSPIIASDPDGACRPYRVLLLTDGVETCGGDPVTVAGQLATAGIPVHVIGLAIAGGRGLLNDIATAGGTDAGAPGGDTAFFADDEVTLSAGLADIVADSLLVEVCNDADDDCDTLIDEGFVKYCNRPAGTTTTTLCADPGETVCDGLDDNCNGLVDEGLLNACGTCGPAPMEVCDGLDNNCNGVIDEGDVCMMCRPEAEICDDEDNDCDGMVDEMLTRTCGIDVGECMAGTQTCTAGAWGPCSDTGPTMELCNGEDDDCDGLVDNLTERCGMDEGECVSGIRRCVSGSFGACEGAIGPSDEECNGLDDDCDGSIDEDVMGLGESCGTDEGECVAGMTGCVGGAVVCVGGTEPAEEVCDGLDNDCDGLVDDGIFVGTPCGSDVGECSPGFNRCVDGAVECVDEIGPTDEVCDGLDNDCDAMVDEGLGVGEPCGEMEGLCMPGSLQCVDGVQTCIGEVPPSRESCDCEDNDCDGAVDEDPDLGALCPEGSTCVDCQCALPCQMTEFGFGCPTGRAPRDFDGTCFCVRERCNADTCGEETIERDGEVLCAPDDPSVTSCVCKSNECTFACDGVVCPGEGTVCDPRDPAGRCAEDSCRGLGCLPGEICDVVSGECEPDPCESTDCGEGEACRLGECETSCADVECAASERCERGSCVPDLCAESSCGAGEVCDPATGECTEDMCTEVRCPTGSICEPVSGDCELDPCTQLRCPDDQICVGGECFREDGPDVPDAGPIGPRQRDRVLATGGGGCACAAAGVPTKQSELPVWPGLMLFGLVLVFRRKRRWLRRLSLLGGAALLITLSGCDVDPYCLNCSDDEDVDAGDTDAGDTMMMDFDAGPIPDAGPVDGGGDAACVPGAAELCNDFDDDCDGEVDEDVEVTSDPNNCGACGRVCSPPGAFGVCEDGECGLGPCDVGFLDLDGDPDNGCEYRCLPTAEDDTVCDLRDNDCDGAVDEDVETDTDPSNCGACGRACRFARGTAECVAGECVLADCDENFYDIDGIPGNGCEYACLVADPPTETCNARDDDCDGMIDEGNPDGGADCGETTGACDTGTEMCMGGTLVCVGATGPSVETCNEVDDDCDGSTDETTDFDNDPNNCGSCGNACAEPMAVTRCLAGTCTRIACEPGFVDVDPDTPGCEYACDPRGAEVCNGEDDDCDGDTDEGLTPPSNFCNANGVCAGTTPDCDPGMGWVCNYTDPAYQDSETRCDDEDNDCDGNVDELFPTLGDSCTNGLGVCSRAGTIQCTADESAVECSAAMAGMGMDESCNGLDDDCDGLTDEDIDPADMPTVLLAGRDVRVFAYEASRPDASGGSAGLLRTAACSTQNVIPWTTVSWTEARDACCALNPGNTCPGSGLGWRLCDSADWQAACEGPSMSCEWSYNTSCSSSQPTRCNGAEYDCDGGTAGVQDCLQRTGSGTFSGCRTNWGGAGSVYDLSGNVKEWTNTEVIAGVHELRGGSYNNIESGRTCDFDFTVAADDFAFPNTGFRCCYYE